MPPGAFTLCQKQPLEQVLAEVAAVELVAELVQVLLQELWLHAVIHVGQQCLRVAIYAIPHGCYGIKIVKLYFVSFVVFGSMFQNGTN